MNVLHISYVLFITPTFGIFVQNESKNVTNRYNPSPAEWTEPEGIWSSLLEEWTLSNRYEESVMYEINELLTLNESETW